MDRSSGILLPVSALPGPCGIGDLGKDARDFIDFLAAAGQRYWQILPLNPPDGAHSPYLSASTFAGSTDLLSPEPFVARGALTLDEVHAIDWGSDPMRVDYARVHAGRTALWDAAFARERDAVVPALRAALAAEPWLCDYCLYMALKEEQGGAPWYAWPQPLRDWDAAARAEALERLDDRVLLHAYLQTEFTRQWDAVRAYAHAHGVRIIGDLPIYVSRDSADVWANPRDFLLDENLAPKLVAGCPPDAFSADGQLWGNPVYDWKYQRAHGYDFWCRRIARQADFYDVLRIDHFRGFESFYAIPAESKTAAVGAWEKGPGMSLFNAVKKKVTDLPIIAEDLGYITPEVAKLLADSGYPGMKVLQFAFDSREESNYLPHTYKSANSVVYVGTHDNDTAEGWMHTAAPADVAYAKRYLNLTPAEGYAWGFIRGAASTVADTAIYTMQDLLSLGSEARMNTPSTTGGNWTWRMEKMPRPALAKKLYLLTADFGRLPKEEPEEE